MNANDFGVYYILMVNIIAFITYGADKYKAVKGSSRIPNATLLGLAIIGGSVGALVGMITFRHKIRQNCYRIGIPIMLAIQCIGMLWIVNMR